LQDPVSHLRVAQVGLGAPLVAVEGEEGVHLAVALAVQDPPEAHPLAADLLDLDHVRAEVAEHLGRHRPLHERREVEHPDPAERPAHCFSSPVSMSQETIPAIRPPSTGTVMPVTTDALSLARNRTTFATSSGWISLPIGCVSAN